MQQEIKIYIKKLNLTAEIYSIRSDGKFYYVRFNSNKNKEFSYNPRNVKIIGYIPPCSFYYPNLGKKRDPLTVEQTTAWGKVRSHFIDFCEYCEELQKIENHTVAEENEPPTPYGIVANQLKKIPDVPYRSFLGEYVDIRDDTTPLPKGSLERFFDEKPIIFPFGCNQSQKIAVERALRNGISVIQGPPGTGKTQTILNIIANIIIRRGILAVVSNNNSATKNVQEKLASEKWGLSWLVAELGSKQNRIKFFKSVPEIKLKDSWNENIYTLGPRIKELHSLMDEYYEKSVRLQKKKEERYRIEEQLKIFLVEEGKQGNDINKSPWKNLLGSYSLEQLNYAEEILGTIFNQNINLLRRILARIRWFFNGFGKISDIRRDWYAFPSIFVYLRTTKLIEELSAEVQLLEQWLQSNKINEENFADLSKKYFLSFVADSFKGMENEEYDNDTFAYSDSFWKRFPIVTSSTYALYRSAPRTGKLFDYLIIDEASQVTLPPASVCFSLAHNAVIVGDTRQLPAIVPEGAPQPGYVRLSAYDASERNILDSVLMAFGDKVPVTTLREHYRCHPDIIEFCNRLFYGNELIAMTSRDGRPFPFKWIKESVTRTPKKEEGNFNERQILDTKNLIEALVEKDGIKKENIGIISPYRNQAKIISKNIDKVISDTVHRFQGREKDIIIYNSVKNVPTKFNDNPNLLNVAVSRAKDQFILVAPDFSEFKGTNLSALVRYIQHLDPELRSITDSKYRSIFDVLYENARLGRRGCYQTHEGESPAEATMREVLDLLLKQPPYRTWTFVQEYPLRLLPSSFQEFSKDEVRYMLNGSRLDFLIYDTMDQRPIFAMEVDGASYHRDGSAQAERDKLKNGILEKIGIPLRRFRTDSVVGNEVDALTAFCQSLVSSSGNKGNETTEAPRSVDAIL